MERSAGKEEPVLGYGAPMDAGAKIALLVGGGAALWGLLWWAFERLTGGPPLEDPTVGDGDFGSTLDD